MIFDFEYIKETGATLDEIEKFKQNWNNDLTLEEVDEINARQKNPHQKGAKYYDLYKPFDPKLWSFPKKELPIDYLEFLKYSNGGEFANGKRYLQFFGTYDFREMNIDYELPQYMKFAVSFAMDGCGNHLLFDMRESFNNNDYPILASHSSVLEYEDSKLIANSFSELFKGKTSIDYEINKDYETINYPDDCKIYLYKQPKSGKSGLLKIKNKLKLNISIGDMVKGVECLPYLLLDDVKFVKYYRLCIELSDEEDCIEIVETQTGKTIDLNEWN